MSICALFQIQGKLNVNVKQSHHIIDKNTYRFIQIALRKSRQLNI